MTGQAPMAEASATLRPLSVIVVATSAGGLSALSTLLAALPDDLPAALVLVQHLLPAHPSALAAILSRRSGRRVVEAREGDRLEPGVVFIAPPDHHLVISDGGTLALTDQARVHFVRPSADLLFESAAEAFGDRAIGVVLTGSGSDGEGGVRAIKSKGGRVIAQDPASSDYLGMPSAAIRTGCVDRVLPLDEIAPALVAMVTAEGGR